VFLGYHSDHKEYHCLDLATNRIIISRHVNFDESSFPFAELPAPLPSPNLDFLSEFDHVCSPVPSPFVAGLGVASRGVPGTLAPPAVGHEQSDSDLVSLLSSPSDALGTGAAAPIAVPGAHSPAVTVNSEPSDDHNS
jgi:hypothetical protein